MRGKGEVAKGFPGRYVDGLGNMMVTSWILTSSHLGKIHALLKTVDTSQKNSGTLFLHFFFLLNPFYFYDFGSLN